VDCVYIVIGIEGEYSSRREWVAGVYLTETEAISVAEAALRNARDATAARLQWNVCRNALFNWNTHQDLTPDQSARVGAECGPAPAWPEKDVDDYTITKAPIGVFGEFEGFSYDEKVT
jgi:hypothetical protein